MDEPRKYGFDEMTKLADEKGKNLSMAVVSLFFMHIFICTHRRAMQRTACLHLVAIANQGHTFALTKYMLERIRGFRTTDW